MDVKKHEVDFNSENNNEGKIGNSWRRLVMFRRKASSFVHRWQRVIVRVFVVAVVLFVVYQTFLSWSLHTVAQQNLIKFHPENIREQRVTFSPTTQAIIPKIYVYPRAVNEPLDLLIMISSSPNHAGRRSVIRDTWANCNEMKMLYHESKYIPKSFRCRRIFMLGRTTDNDTAMIREAEKYQDLIISDYVDNYKSITRKLLSTFRWAHNHSPRYILKSDDDVFIHVPRLILQVLASQHKRYYGGILYQGRVMRNKKHKHFVSEAEFNEPKFPAFCRGALYVFSGDLLPELLNATNHVPVFGVDDAFVGILMRSIGVFPRYIDQFVYVELKGFLDYVTDCALKVLIGLGDGLTEHQIRHVHQRVKTIDSSLAYQIICLQLPGELLHMSVFVLVIAALYYLFSTCS